jgi:hypothetical protein
MLLLLLLLCGQCSSCLLLPKVDWIQSQGCRQAEQVQYQCQAVL